MFITPLASCSRSPRPGLAPLPPGIVRIPGIYRDVGPRWSHDGKRIAFLRRTTDRALQLCIASADLSQVRPILAAELVSPDRSYDTGLAGYDTPESLEWSPDDRQVAFSRPEGFTFEDGERLAATGIWACNVSTGKTTPLAIHARKYARGFYFYLAPRWSPDGRLFACVGEGIHGETALHIRPLAGMSPTGVVPCYDQYEDIGWPAWSPDGILLAFRQRTLRKMTADPVESLRVISPGGLTARNLAALRPDRGKGPGGSFTAPRITGVAWSPDGQWIAFAMSPDGQSPRKSALYVVDAKGAAGSHAVSTSSALKHGGLFAPTWISRGTLGALRTAAGGGLDAVAIRLSDHPPPIRMSAIRVLCHVPTDDLDWSPDRSTIVCASPDASGHSSSTTLRIIATGI